MYQCINVGLTHPILPFITITRKFLSKHCIKRVLDTEMNGLSLSQFYRQTFLWCVDPKLPKNVKFSLSSIIETFPRGGTEIIRGGAKRSRGRCANRAPHLPSKSGHDQFWVNKAFVVYCSCWILTQGFHNRKKLKRNKALGLLLVIDGLSEGGGGCRGALPPQILVFTSPPQNKMFTPPKKFYPPPPHFKHFSPFQRAECRW
jgi:hypothetical protein